MCPHNRLAAAQGLLIGIFGLYVAAVVTNRPEGLIWYIIGIWLFVTMLVLFYIEK